jgi:peptidoglycan hydrolase CwlO-like protein
MKKILVCFLMIVVSVVILSSVSSAGVMLKGKSIKVSVKKLTLSDVAKDLKAVQQEVDSTKLTIRDLQAKIVSNEIINRQMIAEERISTLEKKVSALSGWVTLLGSVTAILAVLVVVALISILLLSVRRKTA